jgi:predicted house-cleaning noncanonical NTP pyrophosphatase (MazG superfamily)
MPRFRFKKLVRDRIPELLEHKHIEVSLHKIGGEELAEALLTKLQEELTELKAALTVEEEMEEMADLLEVLRAYAAQQGVSWGQIEARRVTKAALRGAFRDGVFVDYVTVEEDNPEIRKYRDRPEEFHEFS